MKRIAMAPIFALALASASFAATTLISSTIQDVDKDGRTVTVRTDKGESYTLNVADREAIKGVKKGDQVSLEIGPDDSVHKIIKMGSEGGGGGHETRKGRSSESEQ